MTKKTTLTILRILYPIWMVLGIFGVIYVPSLLVIPGNATATAANIIANDFLFRSGIIASLLTQLAFIFAVLLLYKLFESINKDEALLMVVLALVSVPIAMLSSLNNVAAIYSVNQPQQMMLFLSLNDQGVIIASIFWGLWLFPLGYLVYKSGYFPKVIGWALFVGGLGYTLGSLLKLLTPNLQSIISICEVMTMGEIVFLAWLVIRGAKLDQHV